MKNIVKNIYFKRIIEECNTKGYVFLMYETPENVYINDKTKLKLYCPKCKQTWNSCSFGHFVRDHRGCPNCNKQKKITQEEANKRILDQCIKLNYEFLGYNNNSNTYQNTETKLILKCNQCGEIWKSTTFHNFCSKDRKSHVCNKKTCNFSKRKEQYSKHLEKQLIQEINSTIDTEKYTLQDINASKGKYNAKLTFKCSLCGENFTYTYKSFNKQKERLRCKNCQRHLKFTNEEATEKIKQKCEELSLTFVDFLTPNGLYFNRYTKLRLLDNKTNKEITTSFKNLMERHESTNFWSLEQDIKDNLLKENIDFNQEQTFPWLKYKNVLRLDFFLPKYNIAIECQGRQHFESVKDFGGDYQFQETQKRDKIKKELCEQHGIKLLYYVSEKQKRKTFLKEKLYNNKEKLIKKIKEYGEENSNFGDTK